MSKAVSIKLLQALRLHCRFASTRHVSSEEQLAIFLRISGTGLGNREHQERFQRSGENNIKMFSSRPGHAG
ncbi:hypothetical protein C8J57DRAFT_1132811 [Mycena rebaudengoi]|nr:hypothetical protein C8J57DRAFT_1132811 [Mycena rebaudengoi]